MVALKSFEDATFIGEMSGKVIEDLQTKQKDLYGQIRDSLTDRSKDDTLKQGIYDAGQRLSGAKALLDAFITLGLPRALEADDFLRSLLHGNQRLLDEDSA